MSELGLTIKRVRLSRKISQSALAIAVGVAQPHISEIETGDWAPPRDVLIRIARELQAPEILLEALRHSPILHEVLSMLGVDQRDPSPHVLIDLIRKELTLLEGDIASQGADPQTRSAGLIEMCRMLTLILAARSHSG
ncbi:MAG: helix-turn-helix domain-containing protein [Pedobacter sp.]